VEAEGRNGKEQKNTCSPDTCFIAIRREQHKRAHKLGVVNVVWLWLLRRCNVVVSLADGRRINVGSSGGRVVRIVAEILGVFFIFC